MRPVARDATIRRFRPGRDYTVAVSGDPVPVIDATFCFLGSCDLCENQNFTARCAWRCRFITADGSQHGRFIAEHPTHWLISKSGDEAWASGEVGGFETYIEAEDEGDADAAVYAGESGEGGEEGGDLLSVEAQHNCLSIVLRDPGRCAS